MEAKETYIASDCIETGSDCSIKGKVVVLSREAIFLPLRKRSRCQFKWMCCISRVSAYRRVFS